jgi:Kinesin-like protein
MAGVEEKLGREVYISDETEGIIPRSFRYLWQAMIKREEQFYIKASFMEIYNEQVRDILNPSAGILHTRWNVKNVMHRYLSSNQTRDSLLKILWSSNVLTLMISSLSYMKE